MFGQFITNLTLLYQMFCEALQKLADKAEFQESQNFHQFLIAFFVLFCRLDWAEENMGFASPIRFEPPLIDFKEQ